MAYVKTPEGEPKDKWQTDPVCALHEHYKKKGGEVTYSWKGNELNPSPTWTCALTLPDVGEVVHGSGMTKKLAKMAAARNAWSKYLL